MWAGCSHHVLQKGLTIQDFVIRLVEELMHKLSEDALELFLVQSWLLWHRHNWVVHGGFLQEPSTLNERARSLLAEYKEAQTQLAIAVPTGPSQWWQPPNGMMYKLHFDAAVFTDTSTSGFGLIIRNAGGEVMAAMLSKGHAIMDSEEAKVLACRRALEFVIEVGFSDLIVEGDSSNVMRSIVSSQADWSHLGNFYDDIRCLAGRLRLVEFRAIRRAANGVAHSLVWFARHLSEEFVWLEEDPPPALEALYLDSISFSN